jgi:uncharacterized protein
MTNEEREIITRFIERVGGAKTGGGFGSVPGSASALPPVDKEADALIGELFAKYPEARYRLTQTAFVQEHALAEAQNRLKRLEWELEQAKQAAQQTQQQPRSGGFLSGLFGGGQQQAAQAPLNQPGQPQWGQGAAPPPPAPQYAPGYQPGLFQRSGGSGFLGSALTTAAGVAGGMVVGHALTDLFSPHQGAAAGLMPNLPESPWANPAGTADSAAAPDQYVDQGTWSVPDTNTAQNDPGYTDPGSWGGQPDQSAWNDPGGDAGWTDDSSSNDDLA